MIHQTRLLVSVRSQAEAEAALLGGADLIDVKEPNAGPLGKASDKVISEVIQTIKSKRPVSAAWGEWRDQTISPSIPGDLRHVKWGLAGMQGHLAAEFPKITSLVAERAVLVCYADCERANSPTLAEIEALALNYSIPLVLIDTFVKDGRGLTDWIELTRLKELISFLQGHGTKVALAGSINLGSIPAIAELRPDWIAVRGAACEGGRTGGVRSELVANLANSIRENSAS